MRIVQTSKIKDAAENAAKRVEPKASISWRRGLHFRTLSIAAPNAACVCHLDLSAENGTVAECYFETHAKTAADAKIDAAILSAVAPFMNKKGEII